MNEKKLAYILMALLSGIQLAPAGGLIPPWVKEAAVILLPAVIAWKAYTSNPAVANGNGSTSKTNEKTTQTNGVQSASPEPV